VLLSQVGVFLIEGPRLYIERAIFDEVYANDSGQGPGKRHRHVAENDLATKRSNNVTARVVFSGDSWAHDVMTSHDVCSTFFADAVVS